MIKTVLVATDGSKHAEKAVSLAIDVARKYHARLVVIHTLLRDATSDTLRKLANRRALTKEQRHLLDHYEIDIQMAVASTGADGALAPVAPPPELLESIGRQLVDRTVAAAKKAGIKNVSSALSGGDPAESILTAAKRHKADLIVLGTRGFGELKGLLLGSVSHKVTQHASVPVLTVK